MIQKSLAVNDKFQQWHVGIGDYKVASAPDTLITLGLGSCVGVSLYDPLRKVAGLLHVMLPESTAFNKVTNPAKYADTGLPLLVKALEEAGALRRRLEAKLVGGAQMFSGNRNSMLNIGERNVTMVRHLLQQLGIGIKAQEVGGNVGRTMIVDTATGIVIVRILGNKTKEI
ncbi:MAG: chemotaxis protein CheD [Peptococcaceae bacterium]|nr:chemotaxis protein CheD [Peptococcaceae bacterium]